MEISNELETVSVIIVVALASVGILVTSIAVHELVHKEDYKSIHPYNDYICALILPGYPNSPSLFNGTRPIGYYFFSSNKTNETQMEERRIDKYSEKKATSYEIFVILVLSSFVFIFLVSRWIKCSDFQDELNELRQYKYSMQIKEEI